MKPALCHCELLGREERRGLKVSTDGEVKAFTERTRTFRNRRTGEVTEVPEGVDPGFSYNVGRAHLRGLAPPPRSAPLTTPTINPPADTP